MSRILRRPMFRGGPVSSYGTGIASGLANGGRVHLDSGGWLPKAGPLPMKLGAELGQFNKVNRVAPFGKIIEEKEEETTEMFPTLTGMSFPKDAEKMVEMEMGEPSINTWDEYIPVPERTIRGVTTGGGVKLNPNYKPPTRTVERTIRGVPVTSEVRLSDAEISERAEAEERAQGYLPDSGPAPMKGVTKINNTPVDVNPNTGNHDDPNDPANQPESTTINADDIRAQAALFDELLNEGYEKDKRSAQISDASDYALKFFESTVGQGKGMKEAAGDVAGFALSKPSKTETVKAGQKKTKQTATVMAINEALAQGKSDRELKKILGLADYKGDITLKNAVALATYKDSKNDFYDNYKENLKSGMGMGRAAIFTVEETFKKSPKILTAEDITKGVLVAHKENVGEYFIYPDGKITTVVPKGDGFVEDIVLSGGG